MENDTKEILIVFAAGWVMSGLISVLTLEIYWFGFEIGSWNFELTLLICWNLGIIGMLAIITFISVFLHRFSIVRKT